MTGASGLWDLLFAALALVLVIEGALPFFNPGLWRQMFERVLRMTDGQIRFAGLSSMLVGVVVLWLCWS